jgi:hypothetical protein
MSQITFLLFRLFGQDVAFVSVFTLYFTGSGKSESFFSTGISFYLWHFIKRLKLLFAGQALPEFILSRR